MTTRRRFRPLPSIWLLASIVGVAVVPAEEGLPMPIGARADAQAVSGGGSDGLPEYACAVPPSWDAADLLGDAGGATPIGCWTPPGKGGAEIRLSSAVLPFAVRPDVWLKDHAARLGWELLRSRDTGASDRADSLFRASDEPAAEFVRAACFMAGEHVFLVSASAPQPDYAALAEDLAVPIVSFHATAPATTAPGFQAERLDAPLTLQYVRPVGWKLTQATGLPAGHAVLHLDPEGADNQIRLRLHAVSRATGIDARRAVHIAIEAARPHGFMPEHFWFDEALPWPPHPGWSAYIAEDAHDFAREMRVFVFPSEAGIVVLSAVCPARAVSAPDWLRCRSLVQAMIERIEIGR